MVESSDTLSEYSLSSCRFSFKGDKQEQIRNFEPTMLQKNVSSLGHLIDRSNIYWDINERQHERSNMLNPVSEVARKGKLIVTKKEYDAYFVIARSYKAYKFKKDIAIRTIQK